MAAAGALGVAFVLPQLAWAETAEPRAPVGGCAATVGSSRFSFAGALRAAAGGGRWTIELDDSCSYSLPRGLTVRDDLRIAGAGATLSGAGGSSLRIAAGASLVVEDVVVSGARASNEGVLTLENSTFSGSSVVEPNGGAIYNTGTLTIVSSTFSANSTAEGDGGAIYNTGTLTVENATFFGNSTPQGDGGAIHNAGTLTVTNATFYDNEAGGGSGGAISNGTTDDGDPEEGNPHPTTVLNSLFYANSAGHAGNALENPGTESSFALHNSALGGSDGGDCAQGGGFTGAGNIVDTKVSRCPDIVVDALDAIAAPTDNGGPTPTVALEEGNAALHHVRDGTCPPVDQRGVPRPDDACDVGAYEASRISIRDVTVREGDGCTPVVFDVERDSALGGTVEVGYTRSDGAAACDPTSRTGRAVPKLILAAGEASGTITVGVRGDRTFRPTAPFFVRLVEPVNAVFAPDGRQAKATVVNDDRNRPPSVSNHAIDVPAGASASRTDLSEVAVDAETPDSRLIYAPAEPRPTKGTVEVTGAIALYTVDPGATGEDTFGIRVTDRGDRSCGAPGCEPARSATGTVTVTIGTIEPEVPTPEPVVPAPGPVVPPLVDALSASPAPDFSGTAGPGASPAAAELPESPIEDASSVPVGPGPDLALRDVTIRLVRGGAEAAGAAAGVRVLAAAGDTLEVSATVLNRGAADSPPTSLVVSSPGWEGERLPVPGVPARSEADVAESLAAPPDVTDDTEFVVTIGAVEGESDPTNNAEPGVAVVVERGTSPGKVLALVAAAVVLAGAVGFAATTLLRKPPTSTSIRSHDARAQQARTVQSPGVNDLVDRYLGDEPGPPLWAAGAASQELRETIGDDELAASLIATAYWRTLMATPGFGPRLESAGASPAAAGRPEILVVPHAGGTRYDLLVLDPELSAREPTSTLVDVSPDELVETWNVLATGRRESFGGLLRNRHRNVLARVLAEVSREATFGLVVAPRPAIVPTHCPSPAWAVACGDSDHGASTAGAVVVDASGRTGVTVAGHAVQGHPDVTVDGRRGSVVSSDPISDSSFVVLDVGPLAAVRGAKGPLSGMSPRQMEVVEFDGMRSGKTTTRVVGWDPTILTTQSYIQSKLVTEPVTMPGDSGAALLDREGHILGFAFYTTGLDAQPAHSGWIWAESVFRAHGLRPWKDG
ncbi:MAG TPA: choice-of-anchor Q domain-containing protein [Actinomycetota bacterium]|nr:choice-of-anchor Q domain-containing protein [Actinomycetota bacterium]